MIKLTKGAFAMVLAGAVTFSVTNALLAEQPIKRLAKEIGLPISEDPKKADVISKAEQTMKKQTPTTNVKDGQTKLSPKLVALNNNNKRVIAIKANKQNTIKLSESTTNSASTNEAPITTKPATSAKASTKTKPVPSTKAPTKTKPAPSTKAPTTTKPVTSAKPPTKTKPAPSTKAPTTTKPATNVKAPTTVTKPSGSSANSAAKTTTNRGQQVSQEAKEKAAIHQEQKENNGTKM